MRRISRQFAIGLLCGLAASTEAAADRLAPEELVFLLQYVGTDYGAAVKDGAVTDTAEFEEMLRFSDLVVENYRELRPRGAAGPDLERLRELIRGRAPWEAVRSLSQGVVPRIADELEIAPYPAETPDLTQGRGLYSLDCAPCHGVAGGGDGRAAHEMIPAPSSFRDSRMNLISPHQVYNAVQFGVAGTAMPSYRDARTPQELWDTAFFVMTLRDGFDPRRPEGSRPLSVAELAERSNEEILSRLRASRPDAGLFEIDYYRAELPNSPGPPANDPDHPMSGAEARAGAEGAGLEVALQLERAFSRAAERAFPGVVGISLYAKAESSAQPRPEGWQVGDAAEQLYPGFQRTKTASGFLVSDDGFVLTCFDLLRDRRADKKSEVINVELPGNVHCRARVIGLEPTINLAVLKINAPVPVQPVRIADSDRVAVGQWAIAVGDPPGAEKTFAPGTISARPERDCYQEHRTATWIQTSAAIGHAGFGGPLVNIRGEVIGLTIAAPRALPTTQDGLVVPVNALPINLAMTIYQALKVKESERSPWIGISVLSLNAALRRRSPSSPLTGIYIDDVFEPSPASRAGVRVGDILTAMDGNRILGVGDFQQWLYLLGIDTTVTLELFREGQTVRKDVKIEQRPASATTR